MLQQSGAGGATEFGDGVKAADVRAANNESLAQKEYMTSRLRRGRSIETEYVTALQQKASLRLLISSWPLFISFRCQTVPHSVFCSSLE